MSDRKNQNFLHGAAILTAGVVVMKILGAIYKIPLNNILGDVGYGYFNLAYTIYNVFLTVSTAGLPVALSRMISASVTLEHPHQTRRIFRVAMTTLAAIGAVFSGLMFFFPTEVAIVLVSKPEITQCVYVLSPAVLLICLTSAFRGYIQGHGNMTPTTVGQILEVLVKVIVGLVLAVYLMRAGKSLPIASAGAILGVTVGSLVALGYMFRCYMRWYRNKSADDCAAIADVPESVGHTFSTFVKIGVAITFGASVMSVISLIDAKLIQTQLPHVEGIGVALADQLYGSYSTMQTLYNLPAAFITPMTIAVVPAISAAMTRKDHREVGNIAESGLRISSVIALPMGVGLSVMSYPIVQVLFPRTHEVGPALLSYLGVASVFVCIALVTTAILQATGHEKLTIVSMLAGGAVKIAANLLLVRHSDIHIFGAAIGTICCYLVICVLNGSFIYRTLVVKPRYGKVFARPVISALVMGAGAWAVYGLAARILGVNAGGSKMMLMLAMCAAIGIAVVLYLVMIIATRAITLEDMKLIPKGEKLAKLLHIR